LAAWLLEYPKINRVSVQNFTHRTKTVEDSSVGMLRLSDERILNFEVSWSLNSEKDKLELDFFGTKGTAHLNPLRAYKIVGEEKVDITPFSPSAKGAEAYMKSYENELKHFVAAIQNLIGIVSSIDGALHRMKLMDALYESAKLGKELEYSEPRF
jgi:predicted dehydrogenase